MLLLAGINYRLRSELTHHPVHPAELRRRHHEGYFSSRQFGFHTEIAALLGVIIANDISHNPSAEIGDRSEFHTAISQLFPPDHLCAALLVSHTTATIKRRRRSLWHGRLLIRLVFRPHPNHSKLHQIISTALCRCRYPWLSRAGAVNPHVTMTRFRT